MAPDWRCVVCDVQGALLGVFPDVPLGPGPGSGGATSRVASQLRRRLEGVLAVVVRPAPGGPRRLCGTCERRLVDIEMRVRHIRDAYVHTTARYLSRSQIEAPRDVTGPCRQTGCDASSETSDGSRAEGSVSPCASGNQRPPPTAERRHQAEPLNVPSRHQVAPPPSLRLPVQEQGQMTTMLSSQLAEVDPADSVSHVCHLGPPPPAPQGQANGEEAVCGAGSGAECLPSSESGGTCRAAGVSMNKRLSNRVWSQKMMRSSNGLIVASVLETHKGERDNAKAVGDLENRTLEMTHRQCDGRLCCRSSDREQHDGRHHPGSGTQNGSRLDSSDGPQQCSGCVQFCERHTKYDRPPSQDQLHSLSQLSSVMPATGTLVMTQLRSSANDNKVSIWCPHTSAIAVHRKAYSESPRYQQGDENIKPVMCDLEHPPMPAKERDRLRNDVDACDNRTSDTDLKPCELVQQSYSINPDYPVESVLDLTVMHRSQQQGATPGAVSQEQRKASKFPNQRRNQAISPLVTDPQHLQYDSNRMALTQTQSRQIGPVLDPRASSAEHAESCSMINAEGNNGPPSSDMSTWGQQALRHSTSKSRLHGRRKSGPPPLIHFSEIKQEPVDTDCYGVMSNCCDIPPLLIAPTNDVTIVTQTSLCDKGLCDEGFVDGPLSKRRKCDSRMSSQQGKLPVLNTHISATLKVTNLPAREKMIADDASRMQTTTIQGTMRIPLNQLRESHRGPTSISMVTKATVQSNSLHPPEGPSVQTQRCSTRIPVNMNLDQGAVQVKIPLSQSQSQSLLKDEVPIKDRCSVYHNVQNAGKEFNCTPNYLSSFRESKHLAQLTTMAMGQKRQDGYEGVMVQPSNNNVCQVAPRSEQMVHYQWNSSSTDSSPAVSDMYNGEGQPRFPQRVMRSGTAAGPYVGIGREYQQCEQQCPHQGHLHHGHTHQGHAEDQGNQQGHAEDQRNQQGHAEDQGLIESKATVCSSIPYASNDNRDSWNEVLQTNEDESDEGIGEVEDVDTSDTTQAKSDHSGRRQLLRAWLEDRLNRNNVPGFCWLDKQQNLFKIPWKHRSKNDWHPDNCAIFMEWAIHTGKHRVGIDKLDYCRWKTRLRCAFNQAIDIHERKDLNQMKCGEPYKVFEFLPRSEIKAAKELKQKAEAARTPALSVPLVTSSVSALSVTSASDRPGHGAFGLTSPGAGSGLSENMVTSASQQTPPCTPITPGGDLRTLTFSCNASLGHIKGSQRLPNQTPQKPNILPHVSQNARHSQETPGLLVNSLVNSVATATSAQFDNALLQHSPVANVPRETNNNFSWEPKDEGRRSKEEEQEEQRLIVNAGHSEAVCKSLVLNLSVPGQNSSALSHKLLRNNVKACPYLCKLCDEVFTTLNLFVKHRQVQHSIPADALDRDSSVDQQVISDVSKDYVLPDSTQFEQANERTANSKAQCDMEAPLHALEANTTRQEVPSILSEAAHSIVTSEHPTIAATIAQTEI